MSADWRRQKQRLKKVANGGGHFDPLGAQEAAMREAGMIAEKTICEKTKAYFLETVTEKGIKTKGYFPQHWTETNFLNCIETGITQEYKKIISYLQELPKEDLKLEFMYQKIKIKLILRQYDIVTLMPIQ